MTVYGLLGLSVFQRRNPGSRSVDTNASSGRGFTALTEAGQFGVPVGTARRAIGKIESPTVQRPSTVLGVSGVRRTLRYLQGSSHHRCRSITRDETNALKSDCSSSSATPQRLSPKGPTGKRSATAFQRFHRACRHGDWGVPAGEPGIRNCVCPWPALRPLPLCGGARRFVLCAQTISQLNSASHTEKFRVPEPANLA